MRFVVYSSQCEAWDTHQTLLTERRESSLERENTSHCGRAAMHTLLHKACVCVCTFIWDLMPLFQQRISNRACLIFFHQSCFFAVPGNFLERSGRRTVCLCGGVGFWNFMFRLNLSRGGNYCVYVHVCTLCCTFFTLSNQVKCDNPLQWPLSGVK